MDLKYFGVGWDCVIFNLFFNEGWSVFFVIMSSGKFIEVGRE